MNKKRRTLLMIAAAILLLAIAGILVSPEVISLSPQPLELKSDSLHVLGVYWKLPLAGVHSLTLASNKLTVSGEYLPFLPFHSMRWVRQSIPPSLRANGLRPDNGWTTWSESDLIVSTAGKNVFWRSIMNLQTGQRFSYGIPFKDYYEILKFYHGSRDTSVAIFAFGKRGQDQKSIMGYILITKKVPQ